MMNMLINLTVVTISQCIRISKHQLHIINIYYFVNYMSVWLENQFLKELFWAN